MKKIYFLLIVLFALTCNSLYSQEEDIVKLEINGNVYNYDTITHRINSDKNKLKIKKVCEAYGVGQEDNESFYAIIKKAFNAERIKELAEDKNTITSIFICDIKGKALEVEFLMHTLKISETGDKQSITLQEIDSLDRELKNYRFDLRSDCPDIKYYALVCRIRFNLIK